MFDLAVRRFRARPAAEHPRRRAGPWACLVGASLSWATYTPVTSLAVANQMPVMLLLLVQVAVAAAMLWSAVVVRGGYRPVAHLGRTALLGGLEPAANCLLFALALTSLQAADGSLLLTTESVIVALLGVLVLRERLKPHGWAGLLICLPGLWLLAGAPTTLTISIGALLAMAAATASAIYCTAAAWMGRTTHTDVISSTAWQFTFGLLWLAALATAYLLTTPHAITTVPDATPTAWAASLASGLLLGAPCLAYNHAVRSVPIAEAGIILNLIPVLGAAIGVIWLGNVLSAHALLGGVITIAGIVVLGSRR